MGTLQGKVAVVTGATRGIGKGIALTLAGEGMTVYVTGRTASPGGAALPGSLEETVAECAARGAASGGKAIAHVLDMHDDAGIAALFDRVQAEQGRLDLLVNNAMAIPAEMTKPVGFWEKPLSNWETWDTGVRASFIAAHYAAKIMVPQKSGLIVGLSGYVARTYTLDVIFGTTKASVDRMMRDMGVELKPHGVCAVSLWQGFTLTERTAENLRTVEGMAQTLNSAAGSSPEFPGRVIAALAKDANLMARNGGTWINAELAAEYGVADVDGRTIPSLRETRGSPVFGPV